MKKLLSLLLVLALMGGAAFGLQYYEKRHLAGEWLCALDCSEAFADAYMELLRDSADKVKLNDFDFDALDREFREQLPALMVPVTLEFHAEGSYKGSVAYEDYSTAADPAIRECNAAFSRVLSGRLFQSADDSGLLSGILNNLFKSDELTEMSDSAIVSMLEVAVTNSLSRADFASSAVRSRLEGKGSFRVFLGKLWYTGSDSVKHTIRYQAEGDSLVFREPDPQPGYLALFVGSSLSRRA